MQRIELGKITIKYPESYEGFIGLIRNDLTGVTERKNRRLERKLEEDILKQVIPKPRQRQAEQLIEAWEEQEVKQVRAPDFLIPLEKASRVLKLCIYRLKETGNRQGYDYKGARKISRIVDVNFHVILKALIYMSACKRRGEYIEPHKLHRTLEAVARARL